MSTALIPRTPIHMRVATMDDLPFMDQLQKKHSKALGFFPRAQMQGYVENGWVLVAEARHEGTQARRHEVGERKAEGISGEGKSALPASLPPSPLRASVPSCLRASPHASPHASPVGYLISRDRYLKRDELGVIYQLCVEPGQQRKLVGASLVQAAFDRSAYGCRLYCCWCAQDLEANHFWENLGFVPIAFRGGGGKKRRVHIYWQKRIREGDTSTPWWFPAKTDQGAMRTDRIVLPIPPGVHWSQELPVLEPAGNAEPATQARLPRRCRRIGDGKETSPTGQTGPAPAQPIAAVHGLHFGLPQPAPAARRSKPTTPHARAKIDPQLIAKARELRDRYLERVNENASLIETTGKYAVIRSLHAPQAKPGRLLPAA